MTEITVTVYGTPAPQGSKDVFRGRPVESSKLVKPWRRAVADAVLEHQVADLTARKRYAELGAPPGALVRVRLLGEGGR